MPTYRNMITQEMNHRGETWDDVEQINVRPRYKYDSKKPHDYYENLLDKDVDTGFGGINGPQITIWTHGRVYFGACYDGAEWIESVPRHPCDEIVEHIGGG